MAKVVKTVCDLCGSEADVTTVKVTTPDHAWEVDACAKCYKSVFLPLERKGRPPTRRKRRGFEVVEPL